MTLLRWSTPDLRLTFALDDGPVRLIGVREVSSPDGGEPDTSQPLVEVSAIGYGLSPSTNRHVDTSLGQQLRYVGHEETTTTLRITQEEPTTGLRVTSVFEARAGVRAWSEASMIGPGTLQLTFLSSLVVGLTSIDAELYSAANSWMAENRWSAQPLRADALADIVHAPHHHVARSRHAVTNAGSWSSGERLPVGVLVDRSTSYALGWQIEARRLPAAQRSHRRGTPMECRAHRRRAVHDGSRVTCRGNGSRHCVRRTHAATARDTSAASDRRPDAGGLQRLHEYADGRSNDREAPASHRRGR